MSPKILVPCSEDVKVIRVTVGVRLAESQRNREYGILATEMERLRKLSGLSRSQRKTKLRRFTRTQAISGD